MEHCRWKRQIQCQIDLFTPIKNIYIDEIDESGEITAQMHACEHFFQAKQMFRNNYRTQHNTAFESIHTIDFPH